MQSNFSNQYKATIGAEFLSKEILLGDKVVSMQIWDTAGQEKYQSVQGVFYRGSDGCVLVYDITSVESFQSLRKWKEEFLNGANISNPETFPFVLVGNKADMVTERKVCRILNNSRLLMLKPLNGAKRMAELDTMRHRQRLQLM